MKPAKFVFAAASLAFAFVPPPMARLITGAVITATIAVFAWSSQDSSVMLGWVEQSVYSEEAGATLVELRPEKTNPTAVVVPDIATPDFQVYRGDVIVAFGEPVLIDPATGPSTTYFEATRIGVLRASFWLAKAKSPSFLYEISRTNTWGIVLIAGLLIIFSRFALRVGAGAIFGGLSAVTAFVLLHLSAEFAFLPVPPVLYEPLILAAGLGGFAVGYKATLGDRARIGERVAAVALALPLVPLLQSNALMPEGIAWALPVLALFSPMLTPVAAATLVLGHGLELDQQTTRLAFAGLLTAAWLAHRGWFDKATAMRRASPTRLQPDNRGQIDIDQLLEEEV